MLTLRLFGRPLHCRSACLDKSKLNKHLLSHRDVLPVHEKSLSLPIYPAIIWNGYRCVENLIPNLYAKKLSYDEPSSFMCLAFNQQDQSFERAYEILSFFSFYAHPFLVIDSGRWRDVIIKLDLDSPLRETLALARYNSLYKKLSDKDYRNLIYNVRSQDAIRKFRTSSYYYEQAFMRL